MRGLYSAASSISLMAAQIPVDEIVAVSAGPFSGSLSMSGQQVERGVITSAIRRQALLSLFAQSR